MKRTDWPQLHRRDEGSLQLPKLASYLASNRLSVSVHIICESAELPVLRQPGMHYFISVDDVRYVLIDSPLKF